MEQLRRKNRRNRRRRLSSPLLHRLLVIQSFEEKSGKYNIFVYIGQLRMQNIFMWSTRHLNRKGRWFIWSCSEKLLIGLFGFITVFVNFMHLGTINTVRWYPARVFRAQPFLRHHLAVLWPASSSHLLLENLVTVCGLEEKMNLPNKIKIDLFLSDLVLVQKEHQSWRICF